ncbi:polyphosphate polymerase domain-containing protein [Cryomorphaceae bacterium 1068]|nr:polyphosphate polymerase domain-containing protein [Cryomorphaceae bacterium 1068]
MSSDLLEKIELVLTPFERLGLNDFGDGRFAERRDRKFPCHIDKIADIIEGLEDHYDMITPNDDSISAIGTLYFDTPDYDFFKAHHRGRANRLKVRFRKYPDTKTSFLEVKKKSIKGLTLKERVLSPFESNDINEEMRVFLEENGIKSSAHLEAVLEVNYRRFSFISKDRIERFSIDFEVEFNNPHGKGNFGNLAIVEVKQPSLETTPIIKKLRENRIREASLSKYCLSLSTLIPELKSNRFKPALRSLQALFHEPIPQSTV